MKKFVVLLTKEKVKATMNEWENDDSDNVYEKQDNSFSILTG